MKWISRQRTDPCKNIWVWCPTRKYNVTTLLIRSLHCVSSSHIALNQYCSKDISFVISWSVLSCTKPKRKLDSYFFGQIYCVFFLLVSFFLLFHFLWHTKSKAQNIFPFRFCIFVPIWYVVTIQILTLKNLSVFLKW